MHPFTHYAAAIIVTSALGAFVLCLLVIRYGFTPAEDEPLPARHRRFFVTRIGHAVGAVCFAITAVLGGVALSLASRAPVATPAAAAAPADVRPLQAGQTRLAHDIRTLDERIERAEAALAELRGMSAAARAPRTVVQRTPRPARRAAAVPARDAGEVAPLPPSGASEGESAAAMPRATTDFSAPAPPATVDPPSSPADTRRLNDSVRFAADGVTRLGTEIRKKAVTVTRVVRDFFRDL